MVQKINQEERGVGMQNFVYAPAWDEFVHIVRIHSPRTHQFLSQHFAARTGRSLHIKEARQPKLPLTICPETFQRVREHLNALDYSGPVALSCDNTKLFPDLHLYWDESKEAYFLLGGTEGPILVPDPDQVQELMDDPDVVKGAKVQLWTITIPLPKMTPIVVAALPISNAMGAADLLPWFEQIVNRILDQNIKIISYACDGTEMERLLQRSFFAKADNYIETTIPTPREGCSDLHISIAVFRGQPIVFIQDSKHALKTLRNNLFSGA
ncbi:hypothetical protein C8J56DRAFT_801931 [Mycena floridula]|nr:hypothetical protein C8J56DRAFT_801931 [Mycena floridula]